MGKKDGTIRAANRMETVQRKPLLNINDLTRNGRRALGREFYKRVKAISASSCLIQHTQTKLLPITIGVITT